MSIAAGRLRHRIDIQERVESRDTSGGVVVTWATLHASVPAEFTPLSVREFIASQAMQAQTVARVRLRYRAGLTADMRILFRGAVYDPQGWLPDADSGLEYLTAPVSAGVNNGG